MRLLTRLAVPPWTTPWHFPAIRWMSWQAKELDISSSITLFLPLAVQGNTEAVFQVRRDCHQCQARSAEAARVLEGQITQENTAKRRKVSISCCDYRWMTWQHDTGFRQTPTWVQSNNSVCKTWRLNQIRELLVGQSWILPSCLVARAQFLFHFKWGFSVFLPTVQCVGLVHEAHSRGIWSPGWFDPNPKWEACDSRSWPHIYCRNRLSW